MRTTTLAFLSLAACGPRAPVTDTGTPPPTDTTNTQITTTDPGGLCGDVTTWDVSFSGLVTAAAGGAAAGAQVWVEERAYSAETVIYGSGTTAGNGLFTIDLDQIVSVQDCWGIVLDYYVVAQQGNATVERGINPVLFSAIDNGTLEADISAIPLQLENP